LFKHHFLKAQEQAIPKCQKSSRQGRRLVWLNRNLLLEKRQKRQVYTQWKQDQETGEEYRHAVCLCGEKIHRSKVLLELKLARTVGNNKKSIFKYINGSRQCKNNIGPLQDEDGHLTHKDRDKAEEFNPFFSSNFSKDDGPKGSQCPELEDHNCKNDQLPVDYETVQELLLQLYPYKSMGPDRIHPRTLQELADVITKPLLLIFESSCDCGEVLAGWKLANIIPVFKKGKKEDLRNYRPANLTSVPGKIMEKIILRDTEELQKVNSVIGHSQHSFMEGKSCLSKLTSFYDRVSHLEDQGKPVDVVFLDFSKAFGTASHSILLDKMSS
ncbi:RTJK polymerase, partial [Leucopsar rothschildi]|nr:RTJK polymerase [Leucopsar rothschildi]